MSNSWGQPPASPDPSQNPWQVPKKRRTGGAVAGIAAAVLVVGATAGGWYLLQDDEDGDTSAGPAFTTVSEAPEAPDAPGVEDSEESDGTDAESTVTTVTVTTSSGAENEEADEADGRSAEPRESSTGDRGNLNGGLSCDGRGVLIVNSVMGNSPGYEQEISDTVAQNPGSGRTGTGGLPLTEGERRRDDSDARRHRLRQRPFRALRCGGAGPR